MKRHQQILLEIYNTLFKHFGPQQWWPGDTPFEIAVGAILTQNTNWSNVEKAIHNLRSNKALSAEGMNALPNDKLASLIRPAGYFNVKTKRLKHFLSFLIKHYSGRMSLLKNGSLHDIRHQLLAINGIGPETADSILLYALEKPIFVVDAYTSRILTRHSIIAEKTSYQELQDLFHQNLRHDLNLFNEFHALIVMLGKEFCKPRAKCSNCPLKTFL